MVLRSITNAAAVLLLLALSTIVGCQRGSGADQGAKTRQITMSITGMACAQGCPPVVRDALASLPWVKDVQVSFERKQATFSAETDKYDEAALVKVLTEAGFGGKIVQ